MKITARHALLVVAMLCASCRGVPAPTTVTTDLAPVGQVRSAAELRAAAGVLQRRFGSRLGGKVVVTVHGDHLEVRAPSRVTSALGSLLAPGRLELRRVVDTQLALPGAAMSRVRSGDAFTPTAFSTLQCSSGVSRRGGAPYAPRTEVVACDLAGTEKFHLAVAEVVGEDVKSAKVERAGVGRDPTVEVAFRDGGQQRFTALTRECFGAVPPTNRAAIVLDGLVYSAPTIVSVISGDAQITGGFTTAQADTLANVLSYGALPFACTISS